MARARRLRSKAHGAGCRPRLSERTEEGLISLIGDALAQAGFWGRYCLAVTLLFMPVLGILGYFRLRQRKPLPPKARRYRSMIVFQVVLLLVTTMAARESGTPLLGNQFPSPLTWLVSAAYFIFLASGLRRAWSRLTRNRRDRARILLPDDPALMRKWVVISAMAGITEECAYRGMTFRLLTAGNGSFWLALLICVVSFGLAHATQGWRGVVMTSVVALFMHAIVLMTESLYLAIALHAAYDLTIGLIALPILHRDQQRAQILQTMILETREA